MEKFEYKQMNSYFDYVAETLDFEQEMGWELLSTFSRGNVVTLIFRRPKK